MELRRTIIMLCLAALLEAPGPAPAQTPSGHNHGGGMPALPTVKDCSDAALSCAVSATPVFANDGTLYLAWSAGGRIVVAHSVDKGAHFSAPRFVNPGKEVIDAGPDSRPSIVVDNTGFITVAYAVFRDRAWNGEVRIAHAEARGSFSTPVPIADNPASQRFQTLALDKDGGIFAAWLDKRARLNLLKPDDFVGAGLAWTWIPPDGTPTGASQLGRDNTCECCRLGVALTPERRPIILFRNIFPDSVRDHGIIAFTDREHTGPTHRVSNDDWVISACPHHGPALAIDAQGGWHAAWFTRGRNRQGLFYAHSFDQGASFSDPIPIGSAEDQAGRPNLLAISDAIYLVWKQFDGDRSIVQLMISFDRGVHFHAPQIVATTKDASDHPLLITDGKTVYLSWLTTADGYRLIPLETAE